MKRMLSIAELIREHSLEVLYTPCETEKIFIQDKNIDRVGMQLMGFFTVHHSERCHLIGFQETSYIAGLDEVSREKSIKNLFEAGTTALILANNAYCDPLIIKQAEAYNKPVLRTVLSPSEYVHDFYYFAAKHFAPSTIMHGVLVEVHGEGILITGDSGIGKSETAIELVKRGHRLVADDSVEIIRMPDKCLIGRSLGISSGFAELRGIGIVNIKALYGMAAVLDEFKITAIVRFVPWSEELQSERLGMEENFSTILGVNVPISEIPVRQGRNLAVIVEVNAINERAKRGGYNSASDLDGRIIESMNR